MNRHRWMIYANHVRFTQEPGAEGGTTAPNPAPTEHPDPDKGTDWKAEARKWEARAKENSTAAARLAEIEENAKTEDQKRADRMAALETELAGYKSREQVAAWAAEIVKNSKVPADALRGSTREELEQHFQQIKSLMPKEPEPKKGAAAPYVAGEGQSPSRGPQDSPTSPGRGTLRAAYEENANK